jgi:hypothetical protein
MSKVIFPIAGAAVVLLALYLATRTTHAGADNAMQVFGAPPTPAEVQSAAPPATIGPAEAPSAAAPAAAVDPLTEELAELLATFVPAYAEHESAESLAGRRAQIAHQISDAARESYPDNPAQGRRIAILLAFIGQRESRFAKNPGVLGHQDQGLAHGAWQIHAYGGENPYLATTAMHLMKAAPGAWGLPGTSTPWTGYAPAAEYIARHPN